MSEVTIRRKPDAPMTRAVAHGDAFFKFGDGPGPWTMDAALWERLKHSADDFEADAQPAPPPATDDEGDAP